MIPFVSRRSPVYVGTGATDTFNFSFKVFASSDITVQVTDTDGNESALSLDTDYTVSLNADQDNFPGGSITLTTGDLTTGYNLVILGDQDYSQTTQLPPGGAFNATIVEKVMDRIVVMVQQLVEKTNRALILPSHESSAIALPALAQRLDKLLGFNITTGQPQVSTFTMTQLASVVAAIYAAAAGPLDALSFLQGGAGAVSRTAQAKARERITVEDFGAAGDGATDDTAAFNKALTYAAATGMGVVHTAHNRDYKTTALVTVPTGASLQMGDGSAIVYSGSGTAVRVEPAAPDVAGETYASAQWYQRRNKISVRKATVAWHNAAGNTDTSSIGIQMVNQRYSMHELAVDGFWKNIELIGTDTGYAAGGAHVGNIYTIYSRNAKTHVGETRSGAGGYVNSNVWLGGLMRNDGGYVATGSRGFDGSPGANGWLFSGVNCEGTTIEQIFRFGGPKNTVLQCRFENATAGMIKILSTGGCSIVGGYLGAVGETLVDCDASGIYTIQSEIGNWSQNAVASFAAYNARITATSGYAYRVLSAAKLTLSEHEAGTGLNREDHYTSAGKFHAVNNPTGLTNPVARLDWGSRAMRFRAASRDADADGAAVSLNWATAGFLTLANGGFEISGNAFDKPLRLLNMRIWQDANGYLRALNGAPVADTSGFRVQTTQNESTASRPANAVTGQMYFDTTLGKPIWFNGSVWVDAGGGAV